ncbi:chemotaxis protein CheW [uncultured Pseudoteredinibacter sp.]|uniref:chemotaxis protein CheW n=1 Tax=uncultured Pseudoteredinibacter sp. TaxID=1641701 RepID=UPI002601FDFA|nr:chemotaxis protein CheW [uncultured Pseudoteredinibacter sp.]
MSTTASAFDVLSELSLTAKPGGAGKDLDAEAQLQWSGIGFSLFGEQFIAPVGELSEMLEIPASTRLPGVQPWVVGVANVRGRLLPLFDMAAFFGGKLNNSKRQHRVLILERDSVYAGLIVDQVFGMQHFPLETFQEQANSKLEAVSSCLSGCYQLSDSNWQVFSTAKLIEDPRFANAALS